MIRKMTIIVSMAFIVAAILVPLVMAKTINMDTSAGIIPLTVPNDVTDFSDFIVTDLFILTGTFERPIVRAIRADSMSGTERVILVFELEDESMIPTGFIMYDVPRDTFEFYMGEGTIFEKVSKSVFEALVFKDGPQI